MKLRLRHLLAGSVFGCTILVLLTPLGPWLAAQACQHLAPDYGWRLDIDRVGGRLLGTVRFDGVRLASTGAETDNETSVEIERLRLAPWSYTVIAEAATIQVTVPRDSLPADRADEQRPVPPPLPLTNLPDITITDGRFRFEQVGGTILTADAVDLDYRGLETGGVLVLSTALWAHSTGAEEGETATGELTSRLILAPRRIVTEELHIGCRLDSLVVEVDASGSLDVEAGWPLRAAGDLRFVAGDTSMGESNVRIEGLLSPLHLDLHLDGQASPAGWGAAAVTANVALRPDTVTVSDLVVDILDGQVRGGGNYLGAVAELSLDLDVEKVSLNRWTGSTVGGRLSGSGRLHGKLAQRRYRAALDLNFAELRLGGKPFDFFVDARLEPDKQTRIEVGSTLGLLRAAGELDPHGAYALALTGTLQPEPLLGRPSAPVQVRGQVRPDSIVAQLRMERLPLAGSDFGPLVVDLEWRRQYLDARLALEGDQVEVRVSLDAIAGRLDTLVTVVKPLAMDRILPDLAGTLSGQLSGSGAVTASGPGLHGRLELSDTAYKGWHTGPLLLQLGYEHGRARLEVSGGGFSGRAYVDSFATHGGSLQFDNSRLHYLGTTSDTVATLALSGAADWKGRVDGRAGLAARVNLHRFQLGGGGWQFTALQPIDAVVNDRLAQLKTVDFSTPVGPLTLAGVVRDDTLDVVADMAAIDLGALDGRWQGLGKAALRLEGPTAKMRGSALLELEQAALADRPVGDISFQVDLGDTLTAGFKLEQAAYPGPELAVDLSAAANALFAMPPDSVESRFHLAVTASQLDLTPLLAYALSDSVRGLLHASGDWQGSIHPGGRVEWAEVVGALRFDRLEVSQPGLELALRPGGRLRLGKGATQLESMVFDVEVDDGVSARRGGQVAIEGAVQANAVNDLSLVVEELDLAAIELLGAGTLPQGTIDLKGRVTGTGEEPQLEVTFRSELVDFGDVDGSVRGDSSILELEVNWSTIIGDEADLTATLPWNWPRRQLRMDQGVLRTSSEGVNLLMFLDQLPQLEDVDGIVAHSLELRGFDETAEVSGSVSISGLYLRLIDVKPGYSFPSGEIQFAGKRGELSGLVGGPEKGDGRAEISGHIQLDPIAGVSYSLSVDGEDIPYNFDVSRIDVDMTLTGTAAGARISGRSLLEGANIDLPLIDLNAPPVPPPPPAVQDPFLQGMELDLQVDIRDLHVENEITNIDAEGNSRVYGSFYKPLFQGEILINEGKVFVLNNEFDFQPGRISLDRLVPSYSILEIAYDPLLLNPELDLGAVTTIKPIDSQDAEEEYRITFLLEGPARQVEPRFESDPPLDDKQLLMLVAFGSTGSMSALFDQENRGALYSAAGQLLLSRQVKKIGLDEFQLLTSGTILETVGQPSVHIGKYVKWPLPLWLRYEGLTNDMSLGELRLEYKVRPYITVTGTSQSEQERYGLGMGIEKDF